MTNPGIEPVERISTGNLKNLSAGDRGKLSQPGWVEYTFKNKEKLLYRNIDGYAAFGDVAIARSEDMPIVIDKIEEAIRSGGKISTLSLGLDRNGCSVRFIGCIYRTANYFWGNVVYYNYEPGFTASQIEKLESSIRTWNSQGFKINWVQRPYAAGNVRIYPVNTTEYCGQAYVGYHDFPTAKNYISININPAYSCVEPSDGTMLHEMGHVIGLPHEHARCDRNQFVQVGTNLTNDIKCGEDVKYYGKFDYDSIMLYQLPGKQPQPAAGTYQGTYRTYTLRNFQFSAGDKSTINQMYP